MTTLSHDITDTSLAVLLAYADDAGNWSGTPLVGADGNVCASPEDARAERGNLTQLKKAGLIRTSVEGRCTFITFTPSGADLVEANGRCRPEFVGRA